MDRNKYVVQCRKTLGVSLSVRRAWIEISDLDAIAVQAASLSVRRAWIEMAWKLTVYLMMYGRSP